MFETGVDEMSWDDTENYRMGGSYNWPALADVVEYRRQVCSFWLLTQIVSCSNFIDAHVIKLLDLGHC